MTPLLTVLMRDLLTIILVLVAFSMGAWSAGIFLCTGRAMAHIQDTQLIKSPGIYAFGSILVYIGLVCGFVGV
jgi:hypothetical protein